MELPRAPVATPFPDRVAIASFFLDVHEMHDYQPGGKKCYPDYIPSFQSYYNDDLVLPFSIPLRALSNQKYASNIGVVDYLGPLSFFAMIFSTE